VSHDLETVSSLCDRGIYLRKGEVLMDSNAIEVVDRYREDITALQGGGEVKQWSGGNVYGSGDATIGDIRFVTAPDRDGVKTGDKVAIEFEMVANASFENPVFGLILRANDDTYLYDTNTMWRHQLTGSYAPGDVAHVRFDLVVNLLPGRYVVTVAANRHDGKQVYDWHTDAVGFDVVGEFVANGLVELDATISVETRHQGQRGA
jgi:homopolymeric O-antigen transport system ATP-binding protein